MAGEEDEGRDGRCGAHGTQGKTTQQWAKTATGRVRLHIYPLVCIESELSTENKCPDTPS